MLTKLIRGNALRKTRLHDEKGKLVPPGRLLRNGPRALLTGLARITIGYRQVRPWISYDAQRWLEDHLTPQSRVLEFGSGMSTVWYAERAGMVLSMESYRSWREKVIKIIEQRGVKNVTLLFAEDEREYSSGQDAPVQPGFDLIMIDGSFRDECARHAMRLIRSGGIIYLDNSDAGPGAQTFNIPLARELLLDFARERKAEVTFFTDFAPTQFAAHEGLMLRMPS